MNKRLIRDRDSVAVEFGKRDGKLLVVFVGAILQVTDGKRLAEQHRTVTVGAPVNARMHAVTKADIASQLVQFTAYGDLPRVCAGVVVEREAVVRRDQWIGEHPGLIEEELQHGDAGASDGAVARRIRGMRWRPFGEGL